MVYPVNEVDFQVNTQGRTEPGTYVTVADLETFEISFDNGVEEWNPMDAKGWMRRLMTAKSVTVTCAGKRHYGDVGNDYLAGLGINNGNDANTTLKIVFPDDSQFDMPCVANVSSMGGGDSTAVGALEVEFQSDGKPTYTAAP